MRKKFFAAAVASLSLIASMAVSMPFGASAATGGNYDTNYQVADDAKAEIVKYLITDEGTKAPDITLKYTLKSDGTNVGTAESASDYDVYAGILKGVKIGDTTLNTETSGVATITFDNTSSAETDTGTLPTGLYGDYDKDSQDFYKGNFDVDFEYVDFPEPGVYRYTIEETEGDGTNITDYSYITNLDKTKRTIDVFVVDDSGDVENVNDDGEVLSYTFTKKLKVQSVVVYSDVITTKSKDEIYKAADDTAEPPVEASGAAVTKSEAFNNEYIAHDITLSKTVTGNQGSKDKYFAFEVAITNAGANTKILVQNTDEGSTFDVTLDKTANVNSGIASTVTSNPTEIETDADGSKTVTIYLMHGQSVKLHGLPDGAKYTITENNADDYTKSANVDETVAEGKTADAAADSAIATNGKVADNGTTGIQGDTTIAYTNNKEGIIPTGVLLSVAAPALIGIIVLGGILFLIIKNRRRETEED